MRIAVLSVQVPFVRGGAEVHADNLIHELRARGFEAELITLPFKWYPPQAIIDTIAMARTIDLREASGVKIDRLIGLKFPAYLAPHPNKVLWILHQHRTAYELWDHSQFSDLIQFPDGQVVRDVIRQVDTRFIPEARAVYANSRNVAERLHRFNGIAAKPLYHPPNGADAFYSAEAQDYLFFPSRITPLKRQGLVIEALAHCEEPVQMVFAGAADTPSHLAGLKMRASELNVQDRIVWEGFILEKRKHQLYAECLAVVFPPTDEDYGYVTLEAMLAQKPVITASDSGGPLEFLLHGESGLIVEPEPLALARAMDELWRDKRKAAKMGMAGHAYYAKSQISWNNVVDALTA